ncbi:hypothetical protein GWI34_30250 [Actinomadura sp. DSM 109109]|nr:hypothetical protein [Actinomadura lepetitiana]
MRLVGKRHPMRLLSAAIVKGDETELPDDGWDSEGYGSLDNGGNTDEDC